jgi:hypothetical protein
VQVSQVHKRNDEYTVFKPYAAESYAEASYTHTSSLALIISAAA